MTRAPKRPPASHVRSELAAALAACRSAFVAVGLFSGMSNILMLTGSFFMLEVYDRVLASRSNATLIMLTIIATAAIVVFGILDSLRHDGQVTFKKS